MSQHRNPLRPRAARLLLGRMEPLLPPGTHFALWQEEKCLAAVGGDTSDIPVPGQPDVMTGAMVVEGEEVAMLAWRAPAAHQEQAARLAKAVRELGADLAQAEQARHAVAAETLEAYREMALLQRASQYLNRSLRPEEVAAAILGEFEAHEGSGDWGAVFRPGEPLEQPMLLVRAFGPEAEGMFATLMATPFFTELVAGRVSGIVNDLQSHPECRSRDLPCRSLLALPLVAQSESVGLLLLANREGEGFRAADLKRAQTLASLAAVALRNAQLFAAEQTMFRAFIAVIASAIDAKSPYTAGHCRRVPRIAQLLAEAAHADDSPPFRDFTMSADDWYALEVATYLHDCGKVVTPEWIVDKKAKLESITDRIHLVALRVALMKRDAERDHLRHGQGDVLQAILEELDDHLDFIVQCNTGGEFLGPERQERLRRVAALVWRDGQGREHPLLTEDELDNLLVQRGTLNPEERHVIEDHAVHTIRMLSQIPFPPALAHVVEYAGGHHERLDGSGYPNHLRADQLSIPARIVAIADIFEALTAPDRPYRKPGTLSRAIAILAGMAKDRHIDAELFQLFLRSGVYRRYADEFLNTDQFDQVDESRFLEPAGH